MKKIFLLLPLLLMIFFAAAQNDAQYTLNFAFTGNTAPLLSAHRQYMLADLISRDSVNFSVITGNVIPITEKEQPQALWNEQWDKFMLLQERLPSQLFLVPGEHDLKDTVRYPIQSENENNRLYYALENKPYLFLFLQTTNRQTGQSELDSTQLLWLVNLLKAYRERAIPILLMHHPLWQKENSGFSKKAKPLLSQFPQAYVFASHGIKDVYRVQEGNIHYYGFANSEQRLGYFLTRLSADGSAVDIKFRDQNFDPPQTHYQEKTKATFIEVVTSQVFLVGAFAGLVVAGIFILILLKMKK